MDEHSSASTPSEAVVLGCSSEGLNSRVGCRVAQSFRHIVPPCNDPALVADYGSDGNFVFLRRCTSLLERFLH